MKRLVEASAETCPFEAQSELRLWFTDAPANLLPSYYTLATEGVPSTNHHAGTNK
jgi:hypothetical protein